MNDEFKALIGRSSFGWLNNDYVVVAPWSSSSHIIWNWWPLFIQLQLGGWLPIFDSFIKEQRTEWLVFNNIPGIHYCAYYMTSVGRFQLLKIHCRTVQCAGPAANAVADSWRACGWLTVPCRRGAARTKPATNEVDSFKLELARFGARWATPL